MKISTATIPAILMLGVLATPGPAEAACIRPLTRVCDDALAFVDPPREPDAVGRYVADGGHLLTCAFDATPPSEVTVGGVCLMANNVGDRIVLRIQDVAFGASVPALVSFQREGVPRAPWTDPDATPFCGVYEATIEIPYTTYVNVVVAVFEDDAWGQVCGGAPAGSTAGIVEATYLSS